MCERLATLRSAMRQFVRGLDAALLCADDAAQALHDVTAVEHMAATAKALLAARVAECGDWKRQGARSAAEHIAKQTGTSVGSALDTLKLAERLGEHPAVDEAARSGKLSLQQAGAVASAASAAPDEAARLVGAAKRLALRQLQEECGRTRAAHVNREEQRARHQRQRYLRNWTDEEGAGHIHARGPADAIARFMARITAERDRIFRAAYREGREDSGEAYAFAALERICTGEPAKGPVGAKVIVRVDLDTLLRGQPADGETCEVAGVPVAASVVEDILSSGSAFLAAVLTNAERLVGVYHFSRRPSTRQQTGLEWLYPTCAAEGCGQSARLQRDHRVDWAASKITAFDLLDLLCAFHHGLKTTKDWGLVDGHGKRPFVPPEDQRHPQHAPPHAA